MLWFRSPLRPLLIFTDCVLSEQIARYQAQLATLGGGGGGAAMPVGGAAGPAGGGLGVVPAMASPHPSAGAPVLLLLYFLSAEVNAAVDLLET